MGECGSLAAEPLQLWNLRIPEWGAGSGERRAALGRVQGGEMRPLPVPGKLYTPLAEAPQSG